MDSIKTLESRVYTLDRHREQVAAVRFAVEQARDHVLGLWDGNAGGAEREQWAAWLTEIADALSDREDEHDNAAAELRG